MNGKPWSNHMSSARNAFLRICGLPIWAAGDGVGLAQGGGKGQEGIRDPRLGRSFSWINTKAAVMAGQRHFEIPAAALLGPLWGRR